MDIGKNGIAHVSKSNLKTFELTRGGLPGNGLIGYIAGKLVVYPAQKFMKGFFAGFSGNLHLAGMQVLDPAGNTEFMGKGSGRKTKTNALNLAAEYGMQAFCHKIGKHKVADAGIHDARRQALAVNSVLPQIFLYQKNAPSCRGDGIFPHPPRIRSAPSEPGTLARSNAARVAFKSHSSQKNHRGDGI
ncbi:MAG: hypothetical protein PHS61_03095 [Candidatus Omnitrophica bacterium]|nr:hypothetical protein [Candidatus Omnitrophota bacterium]